jgi:glycosyltransferase involved in cell wall biosynthesis
MADDGEKDVDLLVVSPSLPAFDRNSGWCRLHIMLRILSKRYRLVFLSTVDQADADTERYRRELQDLGIRVCSGPFDSSSHLLDKVVGGIVFEFFQTAEAHLSRVRLRRPDLPVAVDSVDLHFLRELRAAQYAAHPDLARRHAAQTRRRELQVYQKADMVITVSDDDRTALIREAPGARVRVVPNIHPVRATVPFFAARRPNSLLFVGGFLHQPNVDAVVFFCRDILPLVRERLPDVSLTVVGHQPPKEILDLQQPGVVLAGWVPDVLPYLDSHCVAIAPLRFGAGMKGKIGEALAAGLPVVTTTVGAEGMGLQSGKTMMLADSPSAFADVVVRLCTNAALHGRLSAAGREHARRCWDVPVVERSLLRVIDELRGTVPKPPALPDRLAVVAESAYLRSGLARSLQFIKWRAIWCAGWARRTFGA